MHRSAGGMQRSAGELLSTEGYIGEQGEMGLQGDRREYRGYMRVLWDTLEYREIHGRK